MATATLTVCVEIGTSEMINVFSLPAATGLSVALLPRASERASAAAVPVGAAAVVSPRHTSRLHANIAVAVARHTRKTCMFCSTACEETYNCN